MKLGPPLPEPDFESRDFDGWLSDETYLQGTVTSLRPLKVDGFVSLDGCTEVAGKFHSVLVPWTYYEFAGRSVFRIEYDDEHGQHRWESGELVGPSGEDALHDVWTDIQMLVDAWKNDWRWKARAHGAVKQPHELHNEADERGLTAPQLRKLAKHFGVSVSSSDNGEFVDALGIDAAIAALIDRLE